MIHGFTTNFGINKERVCLTILRYILVAYVTDHCEWLGPFACHAYRNTHVLSHKMTRSLRTRYIRMQFGQKDRKSARGSSRCDMNKRSTELLSRAIFLACRYWPITFRYLPSNLPTKAVINPLRALSIVFTSLCSKTTSSMNIQTVAKYSFIWLVVLSI